MKNTLSKYGLSEAGFEILKVTDENKKLIRQSLCKEADKSIILKYCPKIIKNLYVSHLLTQVDSGLNAFCAFNKKKLCYQNIH